MDATASAAGHDLSIEFTYDSDAEIPSNMKAEYERLVNTGMIRTDMSLNTDLRQHVGKILRKLSPPYIIHEEDIIESICRGPATHRDGGGDAVWDGMIADVLHMAKAPGSRSESGGGNAGEIEVPLPAEWGMRPGVPLVHIGNGMCIWHVRSGKSTDGWRVALALSGPCSWRAAEAATAVFIPPFAVLLQMCMERAVHQERSMSMDTRVRFGIDPSEHRDKLRIAAVKRAIRWYRLLRGREGRPMLAPTDRVLTALAYLHEASKQSHDGLKLAVMFTAIESILGEKGEGLTEQIARRTSVLLCSNSDERREAHRFVKELYGYRSIAVHGSKWESPETHIVDRVRSIAFLVVVSVLEWDEAAWRMGQVPSKHGRALLEAITEADFSGKQVVGVPKDVTEMAHRALLSIDVSHLLRPDE